MLQVDARSLECKNDQLRAIIVSKRLTFPPDEGFLINPDPFQTGELNGPGFRPGPLHSHRGSTDVAASLKSRLPKRYVAVPDLERRHSSSATGSGSTFTPTHQEASSP